MQFPLLSRSGVLQRMISEYQPPEDGDDGICTLQLDDIPGGAKAFELAAKFCYDVKIELNALNVVCLRCAAEYLRMTDDYAEGNLITQAESFLSDVLAANWKDSIKALLESILVGIDRRLFYRSTVSSFADQPSETNTGDEPWNGEKETIILCRVKQCDVFSFSLQNI
jgi:hypothetical protein